MNNQNSYLNLMLDSNKSNPKSISHPFYKMMDEKAKKDSKKIDDANKNLMKDVSKDFIFDKKLDEKAKKDWKKIDDAYKKLMEDVNKYEKAKKDSKRGDKYIINIINKDKTKKNSKKIDVTLKNIKDYEKHIIKDQRKIDDAYKELSKEHAKKILQG